jgi:hypothetical protein
MDGKPFATPKIPQLPTERVSEERPFANTGHDFAGPLNVKIPSQSDSKDSEWFILLFSLAHQREQFI